MLTGENCWHIRLLNRLTGMHWQQEKTMPRDFKAEMAEIWNMPDHAKLMRAAVDFLRSGDALHMVNGMDRAAVADNLESLWLPGPHRAYRDMLDASDVRDL